MFVTKKLLNILAIALIYCGAVFGAGFASGREIFSFFSCYKMWGIVASVFSSFLFSFLGYHICKFSKTKNIRTTEEYLKELFPKSVAKVFSFLANAFLVLSFCIMITGCGTLFYEQFNIPIMSGALFSLAVCFFIIKNKVSGLEKFNFFATPLMLAGVVGLCVLCALLPKTTDISPDKVVFPMVSGVLYVSYNMVSAVAVLVSASKIAKTAREAALGGMLGGILTGVPLVLMSTILAHHWEVASFSMPFFALIHNNFAHLGALCSVVLYLAMLTTAVSSGVSVLDNAETEKGQKGALFLCILAFFVSFMPFTQLVLSVYSAFGVIGIVLIGAIFIKNTENKRNKLKIQRKIKKPRDNFAKSL